MCAFWKQIGPVRVSEPLAPEATLELQAVYVAVPAVPPDAERIARVAPWPRIQVVGDRAPDDLNS